MHHIAYEMRDLNHLQTTLDHLAKQEYRLHWGPGRHGPGHNIFTYHRDPDGNVIELFTQLDVMYDESKGYFEPRPWHEDSPQVPKSWEVDIATANSWGPGADGGTRALTAVAPLYFSPIRDPSYTRLHCDTTRFRPGPC